MASSSSDRVKEVYRNLMGDSEPWLLRTNLRMRWIWMAIGWPLFTGLCLLFGSWRSFQVLLVLVFANLLANAGVSLALRRSGGAQLIGCLAMITDLATLTAVLAIFGLLQGPLVGMYAVAVIGGAMMWSGPATVIASVVGVGCYAAALVLTQQGALPPGIALEGTAASYAGPILLVSVLLLFTGPTVALNMRLLLKRATSAERRYQAVFDAAPTPILIYERQSGRYIDANEAGIRLSGLPRDELVGSEVADLLEPESRGRLEAALLDGPIGSRPPLLQRLVTRQGRKLFVELALAPIELGGREAVVLAVRDRTAEVQLEEERREYAARLEQKVALRTGDLERTNLKLRELQTRLVEAERLGIAGELAGGIAHAIYNPLAALIGHMEMRLEDSRSSDPHDEHVLHLARRVEAIVEGMLTLSRRGRMRPERLNLDSLIYEVRDELAERCRAQGVEVETTLAPDLPSVTADRALLTTALVSVAENAVDAMKEGGKLRLDAERVSTVEAVRVRVRDTGPGIPAKIHGRIFEPFFSTKPRGVGLGLAIARGIILGHEGSIRLESLPTLGTEAVIEIPLRPVRESCPQ